jgi:transcriptional regulator with XRE-family HTH domain
VSTPIGRRIRNIREAQGMGRQEFAEKTGINKGTLIGIEVSEREVMSGILSAISKAFPEYTEYLISDQIGIKQKNPEVENLAQELPVAKKAK